MNIGIDIMGGDFAPNETIKGVILARKELKTDRRIFLFGAKELIINKLHEHGGSVDDFDIVDCSENLEMGDDPVKSFMQKTDSGMVKGFKYLKDGVIDGFASAGNTGAMLVGSSQVVGLIDKILRPCISSYVPNDKGKSNLLLDVGINADAKPENLLQQAYLGHFYALHTMGIKNPKIGLLNIGNEKSKGNMVTKATYALLAQAPHINFIGNVEGNEIYRSDVVDVIITDGFTGNIVLKQAESFYRIVKSRNINDPFFDGYNYENVGGTPVLGINKCVVVNHGISNDVAIKNMVLLTNKIVESKLCEIVCDALKNVVN